MIFYFHFYANNKHRKRASTPSELNYNFCQLLPDQTIIMSFSTDLDLHFIQCDHNVGLGFFLALNNCSHCLLTQCLSEQLKIRSANSIQSTFLYNCYVFEKVLEATEFIHTARNIRWVLSFFKKRIQTWKKQQKEQIAYASTDMRYPA